MANTLGITAAAAVKDHYPGGLPLPTRLVTQFPQPSWIENIAVRPNGDLLLTQLFFAPPATLYTLPSPHSPGSEPIPLHAFANVTSLLGIAESAVHPDLFVLVGGVNPTATSRGSFSAWTIDFRSNPPIDGSHETPVVTHLASLEQAVLPNGVCSIPGKNAVLVADSFAGVAWHLDISTGTLSVGVSADEMAPPTTSNGTTTVGINGLKIYKDHLYWTNSASSRIYRIRIDADGKALPGTEAEMVVELDAVFVDDFATSDNGVLWAATNSDNRLFAVDTSTKKAVVVAGSQGEMTLAGDTAAAFGRTRHDGNTLYVVTCGGLRQKVNGTLTEGAKVVAVDTAGFKR